jgi:hypothetical protein
MRLVTLASLAATCLLPGLALAQQPAPAQGTQQQPPTSPAEGAAEVVGLFGQTCVHYAGNAAALRSWLTQEHAPQMPAELATYFLAGRRGQVYDVSTQNARLALVSADDNTCSAYVDVADPATVVQDVETAMKQANLQFAMQGDHPDQQDPSLHHRDYRLTLNGAPWLVLVTTASAATPGKPQAVLTLHPGS